MLKNLIIISVILFATFLSQQGRIENSAQKFLSNPATAAQDYIAQGSNWVADKAYPAVTGEVGKRADIIKNEVSQEKEKISETIGEKIKNYFSGVVDSVFNPGKKDSQQNCNCQTQESSK